jgi:hypothetical protein
MSLLISHQKTTTEAARTSCGITRA